MKRLIALAVIALAPTAASAMESVPWNFTEAIPDGIAPRNLTTVEASNEGIYVRTSTDGMLLLPTPGIRADSLVLTVTNVDTPEIALIWQTDGLAAGEYYQSVIALPVGQNRAVNVPLSVTDGWDGDAPAIGLAFPAGAELLVRSMEWRSYSPLEKLREGFLSFWTTDRFTLYSINFLWGPLIGTTPEARAELFATLPPKAWSATRLFYAALALAAVGSAAYAWNKPDRRGAFLGLFAIAGAAAWIVFDARMTQEIVAYAARDWATHVLAADGEKTLRTHANLYEVVDDVDELLGDDPTYALVAKEGTPFFANLRYALYPAVPVPGAAGADAKAWVVLASPDVRVHSGALVRDDGTVLAPRGTVVKRFDDSSFFFRALP